MCPNGSFSYNLKLFIIQDLKPIWKKMISGLSLYMAHLTQEAMFAENLHYTITQIEKT